MLASAGLQAAGERDAREADQSHRERQRHAQQRQDEDGGEAKQGFDHSAAPSPSASSAGGLPTSDQVHQAGQRAQQAHAVDEGRLEDLQLRGGFAAFQELVAGAPHEPAQPQQHGRADDVAR